MIGCFAALQHEKNTYKEKIKRYKRLQIKNNETKSLRYNTVGSIKTTG